MPGRLLASALLCLILVACAGQREPQSAAPSTAEGAPRPRVLAEAQTDWPHVVVQVTEVTRVSGHALRIGFLFVNTSTTNEKVTCGGEPDEASEDADPITEAYLLDAANRRKFFIMHGDGDKAQCSAPIGELQPGERKAAWAVFAAPPQGQTRLTVVVPHVRPLEVTIGGMADNGG